MHAIGRSAAAGWLVPFLLRNFSYWGVRLMLLGLLLNMTVMAANGGMMPVDAAAVDAVGRQDVQELQVGKPIAGTKNVLLASQDIKLPGLSDSIILPLPKPFTKAVSVGDLVILPGAALAFLEVARRYHQSRATHFVNLGADRPRGMQAL